MYIVMKIFMIAVKHMRTMLNLVRFAAGYKRLDLLKDEPLFITFP